MDPECYAPCMGIIFLANYVLSSVDFNNQPPSHATGNSCNPTLCYYSSMCRCNALLLETTLLTCHSTTTLLVEGVTVNVTHYTMITPGQNGTAIARLDKDIPS